MGDLQEQQHQRPLWWNSAETAHRLGVPEPTVAQWRYKGTGPRSYKIGRHRLYRPEDVEAWLEAQADQPAMPTSRVSTQP